MHLNTMSAEGDDRVNLVDGRSHRVVLVAHCLLNANAKAEGSAWYAGVHAVIGDLAGRGYSIIQLPCPEIVHVGPGRELMDPATFETAEYQQVCASLADEIAADVDRYRLVGVKTVAVVGIEGGPSCAVYEPRRDEFDQESAPGVFTIELRKRLEPLGVRFVSVSHHQFEDNIPAVLDSLR